jgi:hypothetical protein
MPDGEGTTSVTEARGSDERMAEAFQALGDAPGAEVPEDLRERIWLAVSGELPPEERRELVERTVTDPACAEAWRIANEMWRASQASAAGGDALAAARPATRWAPRWLAAAAVFLLGMTFGAVHYLTRPPGDEFRASSAMEVRSLIPPDVALPRTAFRLRWTPGPEGSRYQVRVTTEDLQVLATAADLTEPVFAVDPSRLAALSAGASVFWQVDVSLPSGGRLTSPTFIARVE